MEIIVNGYRRIVVVDARYASTATGCIFAHRQSSRTIRIVGDCEFHMTYAWTVWRLDALQMFLFDLWYKLISEFNIKYETNRVRFGPWSLTDRRIMYGFNIIEHVVKFRLSEIDGYEDEYIYSIDGIHSYVATPYHYQTIIALAMTMHGSQYLY